MQGSSFAGKSLLAMPVIQDIWFSRSVVFIAIDDDAGSIGFVINKAVKGLSEKDLFIAMGLEVQADMHERPVICGGPVNETALFVLHAPPFEWKSCLVLAPEIGLTFSYDIIEALAKGKGPDKYKLMLGCSGWSPGQLEGEICDNSWLIDDVSSEVILTDFEEDCWERTLLKMGIRPEMLAFEGGRA